MAASCRSEENQPIEAGNAGARGPGNDRRFSPLGVKAVPSYACATEKRRGGSSRWLTRWRTPMATATLLSQRAEPSLLWSGPCPGKPYWRRVGTDSPRLMRQSEARLRLAVSSASPGAPHGREEGGESDPPVFGADAPSEQVKWSKPSGGTTLNPPCGEGRSHHRDPWREGHQAEEEARAATSTIGGLLCARKRRLKRQQPESGAGRNGCRHTTWRRRRPVRPFIMLGHLWVFGR